MAQIPILNGIYTDNGPDMRVSYPVNLLPVAQTSGVSGGYLRPADGIVAFGTGPGIDRGAIEWNGVCYRVMGTSLVSVSAAGVVTTLGTIPGADTVSMDYSFDRLAIAANGGLYYWNGTTLTQVTDPDLGTVLDVIWIDGYFMTTDGENLVVTELSDPTQVNPLKYGSAEVDPDPVVAVLKLRNEAYAVGRHTIEVFDNIGGDFFPFARIDGAQIPKGAVGTHACCVFVNAVAFLGSGRNEAPSIYVGANATPVKIATREIDQLLATYSEDELAAALMEARVEKGQEQLWIHLPDRTIVYDASTSKQLQQPVWYTLTSTLDGFEQYVARNLVWAYDKWIVGHPASAALGTLDSTVSSQYGATVRWEFGTLVVYNESRGVIFHELELVALTGRVALGVNPQISTSYSLDGMTWSQDKWITVGGIGDRTKRLCWLQQGFLRNMRMQRFRGDTQAHVSFARLEARLEPLAY